MTLCVWNTGWGYAYEVCLPYEYGEDDSQAAKGMFWCTTPLSVIVMVVFCWCGSASHTHFIIFVLDSQGAHEVSFREDFGLYLLLKLACCWGGGTRTGSGQDPCWIGGQSIAH